MRALSVTYALSLVGLISSSLPVAIAADAEAPDTVMVTATRSEREVRRISDSVTVIEADEIRASQKTSVADLLSTTPGVSVTHNGGLGGSSSLRIRGAETDHTVVLFDGVKLNDPASVGGGFDFANLLTDDMSRIEVLRGPQSTLWGSQAIGGVVNVVSPKPEGPLASMLSIEGGSRESGRVRAQIQAGGDRVAWRLNGAYLTTDGISAFDERLGGSEKDSYRNVGGGARVDVRLTDTLTADFRALYWRGRSEFDGFPPPDFSFADTPEYGHTEQLVTYAGLNALAFDGRLKNRVGFAYTNTDRENINPVSVVPVTFDADGSNRRLEYQGTFDLSSRYQAVFGIESERSEITAAAPSEFDPNPVPLNNDVRLDSAYLQVQGTVIDALTLTGGIRRDDHDTFGGHTTAKAGFAYSVLPATSLRASYGDGFKAPTLYQLYSEYGNLALRPEDAEGWDAGVEQRLAGDSVTLSATYFNRRTTNQIDFFSCFTTPDPRCAAQPFGFFENTQRTETDGVELGATARLHERLQFAANYTRTNAENAVAGSANFGRNLARRPKDAANAEATYAWPIGLTTTVAVQYVGDSFDDPANTAVLDAYTLVDLRAAYTVSEKLEVFGRVENAFDESYRTASGYGSIGRGVFLGVRSTF